MIICLTNLHLIVLCSIFAACLTQKDLEMKMKVSVLCLCAALLFSGCDMSNKAKGGLIGGGGGAALGAIIGGIAGKGKGAAIGGAIGAAVGAGAGVLIGNKMDKAREAARKANAEAEVIKDEKTGLTYVKVTFPSGLLFQTGQDVLSTSARNDLATFAKNLTSDMDLYVYGYTDNQGWRGASASESMNKNQVLSEQRANSVSSYLRSNGISSSQMKEVKGFGESNPVASNDSSTGREQNRRVEVYVMPSKEMIKNAKAEAGE